MTYTLTYLHDFLIRQMVKCYFKSQPRYLLENQGSIRIYGVVVHKY